MVCLIVLVMGKFFDIIIDVDYGYTLNSILSHLWQPKCTGDNGVL